MVDMSIVKYQIRATDESPLRVALLARILEMHRQNPLSTMVLLEVHFVLRAHSTNFDSNYRQLLTPPSIDLSTK